jgi:hypothetical protein
VVAPASIAALQTVPSYKQAVVKRRRASLLLEESDSDEDERIRRMPRVDVKALSSESVIELLGAHTDREAWPVRTDVCCWNCTYQFQTIPLCAPGGMSRDGRLSDCIGVFCSFNCAKRYSMEVGRRQTLTRCDLVSFLHKRVLGSTIPIVPAPTFKVLKRFGGFMDIEEFRSGFVTLPPSAEGVASLVEEMQKNCIPRFQVVHVSKHAPKTASAFARLNPLAGSDRLVTSMQMKIV